MDPDFDALWDQIVDDQLNDNTEENIMQLILESQQQNNNNNRQRRKVIDRNREEGHNRLFRDYFSENPVYTEAQFRRRFRMRRTVFLKVVEALSNHDDYFKNRVDDAVGRMGLSSLQKCTAAIHMLAYGSSADNVNDYLQIEESAIVECLDRFAKARKGQYSRGDPGKTMIMLEAVTSQDLWLWHVDLGTTGSNNDINMLSTSNVFNDVLNVEALVVQYTVNRTLYNMRYYLADDIYPECATFVKTIPMPQGEKRQLFAKRQELARKDVERAFGVLQSRFAIVRGPTCAWRLETIKHIMYACIILHNMIVEDERNIYASNFDDDHIEDDDSTADSPHPLLRTYIEQRRHFCGRQNHRQLQTDLVEHRKLQRDLVEHIWEHFIHEDGGN